MSQVASKSGQEPSVSTEDSEELRDGVDKTLDRLKTLYEQYFLGIQKQAPSFIHNDVERKLRDLTQINIRNTGLRYRLATLQQKFGSYNSYWRRTLRQIENGTYARNLAKIGREAARTGSDIPDEILAAMPKRMREQVLRDRDAALAIAKRRQQDDIAAAELLAPDDEEPAQIKDAPVRDTKTRSGAHVLSEDDADIDFNALFSAFDDDAPKTIERARKASTLPPMQRAKKASTMPPAQRPQPLRMPTPNATPTSGTQRAPSTDEPADHTTNVLPVTARPTPIRGSGGAARPAGPPPTAHGGAGRDPHRPQGPHDVNAPVASAQPTPSSGIPRPVGHQASGPAGAPRAVGQQPSGPAGVPRAVGQQPSGPAGVPRAVGQQPSGPAGVPRAIGQQPSGPMASGQPTPSSGIPRPVGHQPSGPADTRSEPIRVDISQPTPMSADASRPTPMGPGMRPPNMRPATGPSPVVTQPIPRPAPSQQSRPIPVMPGSAAETGPVAVESMAGPFPRENTGATQSILRPAIPAIPKPATGQTQSIPKPSTGQTQPIPNPATQTGQTQAIPKSATQTGQTQAIPRAGTGQTQAIPRAGTGQTQAIPRAGTGQTQAIPKSATQTGQTQALPKSPLRPPPGLSDADVNALHAKYVKAKESIGEKVDAGSREKLLKTINQTAPKIMEQYKASGVDFSVVVKDNQVVIKAKPKT